jgi:hypothetical protein
VAKVTSRRRLLALIAFSGCCSPLAACSSSSSGSGGHACTDRPTAPLARQHFSEVLARHDIKLYFDRDSELCSASAVYVDLTNYDTTADEEGLIGCSLRAAPIYGHPPWIVSKGPEGDKVDFVLANAECTIYPRGTRGEEKTRHLEAALNELRVELNRD